MSRANICIKDPEGNDVWISRSCVVIPIVFKMESTTGNIFALIEKRGPAVSHSGEWCCPCGYIDWDETLEEACQREIKEETGMDVALSNIKFFDIKTDKNSKAQTIDLWYQCWANEGSDFNFNAIETKDEILDLRWLKVAHVLPSGKVEIFYNDIDKGFGKWAFKEHHTYIKRMLEQSFSKYLG